MKKMIASVVAMLLFTAPVFAASPYLILSAMKRENAPIIKMMSKPKKGVFNRVKYLSGKLGGKYVIVTNTGEGAINAGIITSILINRFHPKAVIFSGVAGSLQPNIKFGDVVVGTHYFSVNFGSYTRTGPHIEGGINPAPIKNTEPPLVYAADPTLLSVLREVKTASPYKIRFGAIATDQHFPSNKPIDPLLSKNKVKAVAMEDYGVAVACGLYNTPMISIRAISDNIILKTKYTRRKAGIAAQHAADVLLILLKKLH